MISSRTTSSTLPRIISILRTHSICSFPFISYYNKVVSTPTFGSDKNDLEGEGA